MTTPLRFALSELRVAATPETADEFSPGHVLNTATLPDNPANISLTYYSPAPSPDELVIKQRGRRRISLSWSPEKCPVSSRCPFPKTPTKSTTMVLRSSPRKRLMGNEFSDNLAASPKTDGAKFGPIKRLRLEEKPFAQMNFTTPIQVMLKGLSHDQLVGVIKNLIKDDPQLEEKIRNDFPMPDISPMESQLTYIKRNIFKSLPSSRLIKKTDSSAYSRVVTHLTAFKTTIESQSRLLFDSKHWDALLDYAVMAWDFVKSTPIWDNNSHNAIRRHCFKILSWHCAASLRFGGVFLGEQRLKNLERTLPEMSKDCEDITTCAQQVDKLLQKGI